MAPPPSPPSDESSAFESAAAPIQELPESLRPREEIQRRGITHVSDDILLAVLLRTGLRGKNVLALAREILIRLDGLKGLHDTTPETLLALNIKGFGKVKAVELAAALEIGRRAANLRPTAEPPQITTPADAHRLLKPLAEDASQEIFWILALNIKNRLITPPIEISRGTLNSTGVHPREVFRQVLRLNAAAVLLAHNHPSGDTTPSSDDLRLTRRLLDAARLLGISILDHIIIGRASERVPEGFASLRQSGLVSFEG